MIYFLGDVHGNFNQILPAIRDDETRDGKAKTVVFLGDIEAQRSFEDEIQPLLEVGIEVWFIHGNHDTDNKQNWEHLLPSWHRNLNGRAVEIEGLRVAGLGGVFRGEIWHPDTGVRFNSFGDYERSLASTGGPVWQGKLLKHSSTIFPDVYEALGTLQADILVTHEAPSCHPHGFEVIDQLAQAMGVQALFHGHHHDSLNYRAWDQRLGFKAYGVGFCGITDVNGGRVLAGDFDEARRYREQM